MRLWDCGVVIESIYLYTPVLKIENHCDRSLIEFYPWNGLTGNVTQPLHEDFQRYSKGG